MTESNQLDARRILADEIIRLEHEIDSLRHFIEDRIMDDKGWRIEYEAFLDELKEGEDGKSNSTEA